MKEGLIMNEQSDNKCKTKLIRDQPSDNDCFKSKAHERIAKAIADIINNKEGGITIGLAGGYGSGKSTVIKILEQELNDPDVKFLIFDAWAHEGNYLRYVFLKKVIEKLDKETTWFHNHNLKNTVKNHIENGKIRKVIPENRSFLIGLSVYLILIPTIVKLLIDGLDKGLKFNILNPDFILNVPLCAGFLLIIPLFYFISMIVSQDNEQLFQFIVTRKYDEEKHELSSVEYDDWFYQVLDDTLTDDRKFIIVVDNLDRLSNSKILSFLSTLQTFLQYAQNPNQDKRELLQEHLWVIIPYNPRMFIEITSNSSVSEGEEIAHNSKRAYDLEEKRIQLKFEVPKLLLSDWQVFFRDKLNEALPGFKDSREIANIVYISKFLLQVDHRLPRNIIQCVNQIGTLNRQWCGIYPLDHIGYFVLDQNRDMPHIDKAHLVNYDPTLEPYLSQLTSSNLRENIIGLAFNTTPRMGQELLLKDTLKEAMKEGEYQTVADSIDKFTEASCSYIEIILREFFDDNLTLSQVYKIWLSIFRSEVTKKLHFQRKSVIIHIIKSLVIKSVGAEELNVDYGKQTKDLIKFYSDEGELIKYLIAKLERGINLNEQEGIENIPDNVSESVLAFTGICEELEKIKNPSQQFGIPIISTKKRILEFLIELFRISEFSYIDYLNIISNEEEDKDFTLELISDDFVNSKFNENYLGMYKILERLNLEFKYLTVSEKLANYLVTVLGVSKMTTTELARSNSLLDSILYFLKNDEEILMSLVEKITPVKDERIIRIFEQNIQNDNFAKAAIWLYIFLLSYPSTLSFPTKNFNDVNQEYIRNFLEKDNENYQRINSDLIKFFEEFNIDYSSWFYGIGLNEQNVNFLTSLVIEFKQNKASSFDIRVDWITGHWNVFAKLPEDKIRLLISNLYSNYDIQKKIEALVFDPLWSDFYSKLVKFAPNKECLEYYKKNLQNLTEEQWLSYFQNQDKVLNLLFSLIDQIDDDFVINLKDPFINAYADFAFEYASDSNRIIAFSEEKWNIIFRALNRNYYKRCRYKVFHKLEQLEGKFRDEFFLFFGKLLMNSSALKERSSSINSFYIPIIENRNESHIQWIEEAFTKFGKTIILGNDGEDISVFIDKLELIISNSEITDSIQARLANILTIVKE